MMVQLPPGWMIAPGLSPIVLPAAMPPVIVPGVEPAVQEIAAAGTGELTRLAG